MLRTDFMNRTQCEIYHRHERLSRYDSNKVSLSVTSAYPVRVRRLPYMHYATTRIRLTLDRHKNTIVKDIYLAADNAGEMEKQSSRSPLMNS